MGSLADRLRAERGDVYGVVLENPLTRLPRGVYWTVRIEFESLEHAGEEFQPALGAEWLVSIARDWRALEGQVWEGDFPTDADWDRFASGGGAAFVEASFYTVEHDAVRWSRIELGERRGAEFKIDWQAVVEYGGFEGGDEEPNMRVRAHVWAPLRGIMVASALVGPEESEARAREVLAEFVDVETYGRLEVWENEFGVRAWWLRPQVT